LNADFVGNPLGDVRLQGEHISKISVVTIRPKVMIGICLDQLCFNANPASRAHHRTFEDRIYFQFASNFR